MRRERGLDARMQRIEEIVRALESDRLALETALALFEEGAEELGRARELLERAELRIEELTRRADDAAPADVVRTEGDDTDDPLDE
ncbi:MAG: exodeoxyribonuclease VII small subunit [Gemmatimonadetes bacterium]|nr:exodeoxyribonuclease VII small subunit [Gemmatimonadota bacterium]MCY3942851.1 exodeoxyribonuclease VII small subunit [Gemmatimonadota bacterium]